MIRHEQDSWIHVCNRWIFVPYFEWVSLYSLPLPHPPPHVQAMLATGRAMAYGERIPMMAAVTAALSPGSSGGNPRGPELDGSNRDDGDDHDQSGASSDSDTVGGERAGHEHDDEGEGDVNDDGANGVPLPSARLVPGTVVQAIAIPCSSR